MKIRKITKKRTFFLQNVIFRNKTLNDNSNYTPQTKFMRFSMEFFTRNYRFSI